MLHAGRRLRAGRALPDLTHNAADRDRLVAQVKELADQIDSYTASADRYFGFVGTLSIGLLAVLARPDRSSAVLAVVALIAPLALLVILHYVAQIMTERAARIGMKRAIEDHLAKADPESEMRLETQLASVASQLRPSVWISMVLYFLVVLAACAGAASAAYHRDGDHLGWTSILITVAVLLMLAATATATLEMLRAETNGRSAIATALAASGVTHS
ncbi:hypothetical protein HPO96_10745 [Kribbella sandramycini]|uniref:Uncharacterized protein n=1 Tax=Kribbella sandramycini TaxID=60450 RepID=A0A7Y4KXZ8_9ACTN|nr:hypothetical protein [Kribbella sandramycini]MBB6569441.1 hypothetical protein [Kribbella sandramycini]NOL40723.1 hypothetical protein [Kribbella sandramycini]